MPVKQIPIRVELDVIERLKIRSTIEGRSVNEIVNEAIHEYTKLHPVSREAMLNLVRAIAREDVSILKALAE